MSAPSTPSVEEAPAPAPAPQVEAQSTPMVSDAGIESSLIEVVVKHTGYPADFIEMDQDLEGELGIDTVKQAEIMVDVREIFSLPVDEDFLLSDHPTLNHFVAYIVKMKGGSTTPEPEIASMPVAETSMPVEPTSMEHDVADAGKSKLRKPNQLHPHFHSMEQLLSPTMAGALRNISVHVSKHVASLLFVSDSRLVFVMYPSNLSKAVPSTEAIQPNRNISNRSQHRCRP